MDAADRDRSGLWSLRQQLGVCRHRVLLFVDYIVDYDGFNVVVPPTRHQFWYRSHRFNFQCEFNIGYAR